MSTKALHRFIALNRLGTIEMALRETNICPTFHFLEKAGNLWTASIYLIFVTSNELDYENEEHQTRTRIMITPDGRVMFRGHSGVGEHYDVYDGLVAAVQAISMELV